MPNAYQVYRLLNEEGRTYLGLSEDPLKRLRQHNDGLSHWTSKFRPWKLDWTSRGMSLGEARRLEKRLKAQKGGRGLGVLLREYSS